MTQFAYRFLILAGVTLIVSVCVLPPLVSTTPLSAPPTAAPTAPLSSPGQPALAAVSWAEPGAAGLFSENNNRC
jgi:hypothetical protein